jgi:hypothetical protein
MGPLASAGAAIAAAAKVARARAVKRILDIEMELDMIFLSVNRRLGW